MELKKEWVQFIGHEEIEGLDDVYKMCCFLEHEDGLKKDFWKQVFEVGKCSGLHDMDFDNFDSAYTKAREILRARGQEVFRELIKNRNK